MNPPEYNQPNNSYNSTEAWLNSFAPPPPKPKNSIKKIVILLVLGIVIISVTIMVILFISRPLPCLSKTDFKDLTGAELDNTINPKEDFYTFSVNFNNTSTEYETGESTELVTVQSVGDFYKSHQNKSIVISINSFYPKDTATELVTKRIDKIRNDFIQAGVPPKILQTNTPVPYEPDIDEAGPDNLTTVSILSASKCR